jgi:hypothetical protein
MEKKIEIGKKIEAIRKVSGIFERGGYGEEIAKLEKDRDEKVELVVNKLFLNLIKALTEPGVLKRVAEEKDKGKGGEELPWTLFERIFTRGITIPILYPLNFFEEMGKDLSEKYKKIHGGKLVNALEELKKAIENQDVGISKQMRKGSIGNIEWLIDEFKKSKT